MPLTNEEVLDRLGIEYRGQAIKSVLIKIEPDSSPEVYIKRHLTKTSQKLKPREISFNLYGQAAHSFLDETKGIDFDFDGSKFRCLSTESAFDSYQGFCLTVRAYRIFDN